jgi:DNA-binding response OmpR family regulator
VPRILIADDDPLLCDLITFKLEAAGYDVQVARNGRATLDAARSDPPDMIILDSMMPILTGLEVLRELKGSPETEHVPVIILSARKGQADIVEALRAGAADYLTKPFLPDELTARIERSLAVQKDSGRRAHAG